MSNFWIFLETFALFSHAWHSFRKEPFKAHVSVSRVSLVFFPDELVQIGLALLWIAAWALRSQALQSSKHQGKALPVTSIIFKADRGVHTVATISTSSSSLKAGKVLLGACMFFLSPWLMQWDQDSVGLDLTLCFACCWR